MLTHTRTRTNTNPNGTEANAAGRSGNARALRKQSKCGMIQEGAVWSHMCDLCVTYDMTIEFLRTPIDSSVALCSST